MFIITIIVNIFQCTITLIQSIYVKSRSGCIIHLHLYVFISDLSFVSLFLRLVVNVLLFPKTYCIKCWTKAGTSSNEYPNIIPRNPPSEDHIVSISKSLMLTIS